MRLVESFSQVYLALANRKVMQDLLVVLQLRMLMLKRNHNNPEVLKMSYRVKRRDFRAIIGKLAMAVQMTWQGRPS